MESIRQREQLDEVFARIRKFIVVLATLTALLFLAYYAPAIFGGERDPLCEMDTPTAYLMFACGMIVP